MKNENKHAVNPKRSYGRRSYFWWLLLLFWLGVIFIFSSQPYQVQDIRPFLAQHVDRAWVEAKLGDWTFIYEGREISIATRGVPAFLEFLIRKVAHIVAFAILALVTWLILHRRWPRLGWRTYPIAFFLTILYAILDEVHQYFTPGRLASWTDVMIDGAGALVVLIIIALIQLIRWIIRGFRDS